MLTVIASSYLPLRWLVTLPPSPKPQDVAGTTRPPSGAYNSPLQLRLALCNTTLKSPLARNAEHTPTRSLVLIPESFKKPSTGMYFYVSRLIEDVYSPQFRTPFGCATYAFRASPLACCQIVMTSSLMASNAARASGGGAIHTARYASTMGSHFKSLIFIRRTVPPRDGFELPSLYELLKAVPGFASLFAGHRFTWRSPKIAGVAAKHQFAVTHSQS